MRLTREVRFSLTTDEPAGPVVNSWAGWPASNGLAPYVVLRVTVAGEPDARTGYLCNINRIDRAVREGVIPQLRTAWLRDGDNLGIGESLNLVSGGVGCALPAGVTVAAVELRTTPFVSYSASIEEPSMVAITQSFEFSAAHRLFCRELSDAQNREIFGKCTNPNGHGHNYVVEVTVAGEPDPRTGVVIEIGRMAQTVKSRVIDALDHKHLNEDCAEFAELNPSVENITRVIWGKLEGQFAPADLTCVRVYETPKTYAELRR